MGNEKHLSFKPGFEWNKFFPTAVGTDGSGKWQHVLDVGKTRKTPASQTTRKLHGKSGERVLERTKKRKFLATLITSLDINRQKKSLTNYAYFPSPRNVEKA